MRIQVVAGETIGSRVDLPVPPGRGNEMRAEDQVVTKTIISTLRAMRTDRRGVTALEYGLIASLISIAIIASLTTLGTKLTGTFSYIASKL